jgi:hypothetical protein
VPESFTELLRGSLLSFPHPAAVDHDVAVVGYPVNPNGAKGKRSNRTTSSPFCGLCEKITLG